MSFEASQEIPSDFEKKGTIEPTIESLRGPLTERLRMNFGSDGISELESDVFNDPYVLELLDKVPEESVQEIVDLCSAYFEAVVKDAQGDIKEEILNTLGRLSKKKDYM